MYDQPTLEYCAPRVQAGGSERTQTEVHSRFPGQTGFVSKVTWTVGLPGSRRSSLVLELVSLLPPPARGLGAAGAAPAEAGCHGHVHEKAGCLRMLPETPLLDKRRLRVLEK